MFLSPSAEKHIVIAGVVLFFSFGLLILIANMLHSPDSEKKKGEWQESG